MKWRRRLKKNKILIIAGMLLFLSIFGYIVFNQKLKPALASLAQVRVNTLVSDEMYEVALELLRGWEGSESFLIVRPTEAGVYHVELNTFALTQFAMECAQTAENRLDQYGMQGVDVPLGTASGITMFSGIGPNINMKFEPTLNTQASYASSFQSAGINQTLYQVNLRLEAEVVLLIPGEEMVFLSYVDIPVAEQIIVGQVPDTYTEIGLGDGMINLVPVPAS